MNFEQYKKRFYFPVNKFYEEVGLDKEKYPLLADRFATVYRQRWREIEIHCGVENYLKKNSEKGISQFVLSAYNQKELLDMVKYFGLQNYFTEIAGIADNLAQSKIQRGKELISNNNINIKKTLMIGDTPHDFEVADSLGCDIILISWGAVSYEKLVEKCGEKLVVKNLSELFEK
jgi:phosphoglycolate phosphatase